MFIGCKINKGRQIITTVDSTKWTKYNFLAKKYNRKTFRFPSKERLSSHKKYQMIKDINEPLLRNVPFPCVVPLLLYTNYNLCTNKSRFCFMYISKWLCMIAIQFGSVVKIPVLNRIYTIFNYIAVWNSLNVMNEKLRIYTIVISTAIQPDILIGLLSSYRWEIIGSNLQTPSIKN